MASVTTCSPSTNTATSLLIAVKTTQRLREFPFLITQNKLALSAEVPDRFRLYRRARLQQVQDGAVHVGQIAGVLLPAYPDDVA